MIKNRDFVESSFKELNPSDVFEFNPFARIVDNQRIVEVPRLVLESGILINDFPVAFKTWGQLNDSRDNVIVICHALTGSSDVSDWWSPLLGTGLAFDPSRFFIICLNSLGSPYGSFSPLSINPETGSRYGPEFPLCTVRDDVRAHRLVLDSLGVVSLACVIGGSMGGMLALEWAAIYGKSYVRNLVALATSARNSAWCISWSEAQRQSIYSDPKYLDGYYSLEDPPAVGLSAARMAALLTYRSRDSFETKFSRKVPSSVHHSKGQLGVEHVTTSEAVPELKEHNLAIHNDGNQRYRQQQAAHPTNNYNSNPDINPSINRTSPTSATSSSSSLTTLSLPAQQLKPAQTYFSAQSYLRYQGLKFCKRFDANCYISITRKLDTHDLSRDRPEYNNDIHSILSSLHMPTLVIGIRSDGLFTFSEQEFLSKNIPNAVLAHIDSPDGHDAFLLEFKLINDLIINFLKLNVGEIMSAPERPWDDSTSKLVKNSVFGEAEEVTNW